MIQRTNSRKLLVVLLASLLGGCFQTNLGGTTGSTLLTLAPLREPGNVIAEATTVDESYWISALGQAGWEEKSSALQLLLLGIAPIDVSGLDPDALYVFTATGGTDYSPDGRDEFGGSTEAVQGSWHAIASGRRIADGDLQISALSEASYRQVLGRLDQLTDAQVMEQLDAAARLLVSEVNQDESRDHNDVLAWNRSYHAEYYLGDIADLDALAGAVRAGEPADSLDSHARNVLGTRRVFMDTSFGDLEIETLSWEAPLTVDNFLRYIEDDFYDNIAFHRAVDGFLVQTGLWELLPGGRQVAQKPPRASIRNESRYSVSNQRGTLSMARNNDADSANAQFFINQGDNSFLDYGSVSNPDGFTVFARLTGGQDIIDAIAALPTTVVLGIGADVPTQIVLIQSAEILE